MNKIYKYILNDVKIQVIHMPINAEILSVQMQGKQITMWAMVNPDEILTPRTFKVYGTGWDVGNTENIKHIGTVQDEGYVWHIFEVL